MTCDEHLAWCKLRALEYADAGELTNAVASIGSDMNKHPKLLATTDSPDRGRHAADQGRPRRGAGVDQRLHLGHRTACHKRNYASPRRLSSDATRRLL